MLNTPIIITLAICLTILCTTIFCGFVDIKEKMIEHQHNERMRELAIDAERVKVEMEKVKRGIKND